MESIHIKATEDTPEIQFMKEEKQFLISGRSLPEDVVAFYKPLFAWLNDYEKQPLEELTFICKLYYFNTASSKILQDIMLQLESFFTKGINVKVMWYFDTDDEDIIDMGREYNEMVSLPFEMLPY